ncbi:MULTISPECIES: TIGR03915 family putative DNA repair protein [Psychrobacter]|uniref:TIGR03915 family putative DNA repair protein n=1 Tax=Psychrobacter TaxID=497 RepID=UPI000CF6FB44|nr:MULTISPECIES: TIGR03915 family putative DNA repair protein [Psychrobacter]HCH27337.1 DNA metabolism protein [Psychrobacter sp.]
MLELAPNTAYPVGQLTPSIVLYEPSFEGWLSAVFYVYANKLHDDEALQLIAQDCYVPSLIAQATSVVPNEEHAERVLVKLNQLLGRSGMRNLLWGFLSEKEHIGTTLFWVVKYAIDYPNRHIMQDVGNLHVLELVQTVKSVGREKHRMEAFVRFEHTTDDIYFARVEPDFNVLPLIGEHFRQRYQDQHWAIYDITRGYGIYYDKSNSTATRPAALQTITDLDDAVLRRPASIHSADERRYQQFWQGYFTNVNITERKNPRLHRQYLPQRYWKYLSEKQILPNAEHIQKRR